MMDERPIRTISDIQLYEPLKKPENHINIVATKPDSNGRKFPVNVQIDENWTPDGKCYFIGSDERRCLKSTHMKDGIYYICCFNHKKSEKKV